jgi:hypothetical protein
MLGSGFMRYLQMLFGLFCVGEWIYETSADVVWDCVGEWIHKISVGSVWDCMLGTGFMRYLQMLFGTVCWGVVS